MKTLPHFLRPQRGFTLIELMIVVAIVGILASVAYPSYMSQVRQSRRSDAIQALALLQQAQERWRSNNTTYADGTTNTITCDWPKPSPAVPTSPCTNWGLGIPSTTTSGGYYTLSLTAGTATGYTIQADAVTGKSQATDTNCTNLTVTVTNGNAVNSSSSGSTTCWKK